MDLVPRVRHGRSYRLLIGSTTTHGSNHAARGVMCSHDGSCRALIRHSRLICRRWEAHNQNIPNVRITNHTLSKSRYAGLAVSSMNG